MMGKQISKILMLFGVLLYFPSDSTARIFREGILRAGKFKSFDVDTMLFFYIRETTYIYQTEDTVYIPVFIENNIELVGFYAMWLYPTDSLTCIWPEALSDTFSLEWPTDCEEASGALVLYYFPIPYGELPVGLHKAWKLKIAPQDIKIEKGTITVEATWFRFAACCPPNLISGEVVTDSFFIVVDFTDVRERRNQRAYFWKWVGSDRVIVGREMLIKIYESSGRLLRTRKVHKGEEISLFKGFPKGVYFVVGESKGIRQIKKVLHLRD